jgi:hypothetical protein
MVKNVKENGGEKMKEKKKGREKIIFFLKKNFCSACE